MTTREFALIDHAAEPTAVVRARLLPPELPALFGRALQQVLVALETQHLTPGGEPFAYYHRPPNGSVDVEAGFPVRGTLEAVGEVVSSDYPRLALLRASTRGPTKHLLKPTRRRPSGRARGGSR